MICKSVYLVDTNNNKRRYYIIEVVEVPLCNSHARAYYSVDITYGVIGAKLFNKLQRYADSDKEKAIDFASLLQEEKIRKGYKLSQNDPRLVKSVAQVKPIETPKPQIASIQSMVVLRNDVL